MRFPFSHIVVTCPSRDKEECYLEEMTSIPDLELVRCSYAPILTASGSVVAVAL